MELGAPLFVSWQLTRDCNLACTHCCTDSAPGKAAPGELSRDEAVKLAQDIVNMSVPYVMIAGGEPLLIAHFLEVAEILGRGGVDLKVETNGHALTREIAARLAQLPIRSIQVSLDGATPESYRKQRVGGDLAKALFACETVVDAGMPLEVTFAPTRCNIHEVEAVAMRAAEMGAFRFNTGSLMRLGTAARLWDRLQPSPEQYREFRARLDKLRKTLEGKIELCYLPFTIEEGLKEGLASPPATLLVLPDGKIKVAAPLPYTCADVREQSLAECWKAYQAAWKTAAFADAARAVLADTGRLAEANAWKPLPEQILA